MPKNGNTQAALLAALQKNDGKSLSGQQLADRLGISRAAVHKAAAALQKQGYSIQACSGRGYTLCPSSDALTAAALTAALQPDSLVRAVYVFDTLESTNRAARKLAEDGACHGTLILAGRQTAGRGRLGRSFSSPEGGVYLSVILRPERPTADLLSVTGCAAVAVCRAVDRLCGKKLSIKWVNDLFYQGKKVAGILTEVSSSLETGLADYLIVGIGLNLNTPAEAFDEPVRAVAGSLFDPGAAPCSRVTLAAAICEELLQPSLEQDYLKEYRARSLVVGHWLTVTGDGEPYTAFAEAIDDKGQLVVRLTGGGLKHLRFGEVSIRPAPGTL